VGLGVLHTGLAYALIYAGMQRLEVGRIALLQFVYPIAAIALDVAIYGRALDGMQWAGVLLMGAALWWAGRTDAVRPLATRGVQSS
jgi:drug/metabolite transporter (DMT)-like permease